MLEAMIAPQPTAKRVDPASARKEGEAGDSIAPEGQTNGEGDAAERKAFASLVESGEAAPTKTPNAEAGGDAASPSIAADKSSDLADQAARSLFANGAAAQASARGDSTPSGPEVPPNVRPPTTTETGSAAVANSANPTINARQSETAQNAGQAPNPPGAGETSPPNGDAAATKANVAAQGANAANAASSAIAQSTAAPSAAARSIGAEPSSSPSIANALQPASTPVASSPQAVAATAERAITAADEAALSKNVKTEASLTPETTAKGEPQSRDRRTSGPVEPGAAASLRQPVAETLVGAAAREVEAVSQSKREASSDLPVDRRSIQGGSEGDEKATAPIKAASLNAASSQTAAQAAGFTPLLPTGGAEAQMARGLDIASLQTRADFGASAVPRAPASAAAAADGQNAASQIAAAINRASGDRIDLRLDPPELGRVAVSLAVRDDAMIASITADRPETEALLRRHGEELQKALRDSGFEDVSLAFGDQGDNDPKAGDGRAADLVEATMSERETAVETTANARRSDAGLDLRV